LRESEERHRRLFDENPNPLYIYDRATLRFLAVNQAAVTNYGNTREEFLARTILDIRPPDEQAKLRGIVTAPQTGPVPPFAGQWHHVRKDGSVRAVEVFTRNITHEGRAAVLVLPIDLTEKIQAETALRESEERYRLLFEQSPLAIVEFDYTGLKPWFEELRAAGVTDLAAHLEANPALREEVLRRAPMVELNEPTVRLAGGRDKRELMARIREVFTPDAVRVRCENAARIWNGVTTNEGEIEVRRLDTGELRALAFYWRMQTVDGRPSFKRTQTVLVDITERKRAEAALRESEARYREVFENALDGIYRSSPEGVFISANPALARMLGYDSPQELLATDGKSGGAPLYVKPGRREEFRALLKTGEYVTNFESEIRRKNGERMWISENVRAVPGAGGRVAYYEGFVSDVTPRRRLEAEMLRASKLESVGILAGGIAHDFNNILTVVLGNITLAEQDTEAQASVAALLRDAKRATLRARDLTQQLLTFAKGGDPVRAAVELPELLRESVDFALHGAKARAEYAIAPDLWPVNADKGQIGQVVQNLVINAVQAMPQGLVVVVRAENHQLAERAALPLPAGRYVRLSVEDRGVGIPAEHLAKIFDPYFTTKQSGSGLGLATVYSIVKKHQGHVEVESQLGVGTKFHLWLPAAAAAEAKAPVRRFDGDVAGARLLFMDDEPGIRTMAELFATRIGLKVELAQDGAQAVEKYREARATGRPFDVVIMDLTVPGGVGGREATEQLLAFDAAAKVIVSSGYSRDPVMANHRAHGFRGILPKPYGLEQMRAVLHGVLQGRNSASPFS
jgi:PAS domain S-box-containing protein